MRLPLAVLAAALVLAGCGGSGTIGSKSTDTGAGDDTTKTTAAAKRPKVKRPKYYVANPRIAPLPAPAVTKLSGSHDRPVPILMYHVVQAAPASAPNPDLWVNKDLFQQQVDALVAQGYHGVTQQQVWDYWHKGDALPAKPIVLSFDDGYDSQWRNAAFILRKAGFRAVLNLKTQAIGSPGGLSTQMVKEMIGAGWELASHTISHPDLTKTTDSQLHDEVFKSRSILRKRFGVAVNFFCYPSGDTDARVEAAVKQAGYLAATTVVDGIAKPGQDPFEWTRVRVHAGESPSALLQAIKSAS